MIIVAVREKRGLTSASLTTQDREQALLAYVGQGQLDLRCFGRGYQLLLKEMKPLFLFLVSQFAAWDMISIG
jgi:hypothetical protein